MFSERNGERFSQKIFPGADAFRPRLLLERQSVPRKWAASQACRLVDSSPRITTLSAGPRACRRSIALLFLTAFPRPPHGAGASPMGRCWEWPSRPGAGSCLGSGTAPPRSRAWRWRCHSWRGWDLLLRWLLLYPDQGIQLYSNCSRSASPGGCALELLQEILLLQSRLAAAAHLDLTIINLVKPIVPILAATRNR